MARLSSEHLCSAARRRTGLQEFGQPAIEPVLSLLAESLETEANLHRLGRFLIWSHLRGLLETRLKLVELWRKRAPELAACPLEQPLFILGMPRSGSTFLHELLAADSANRAPRVWEVMFPVSGLRPGGLERAQRIQRAGACLWLFRRLAPHADAVYPMRARTPHECVAIHSYSLLSEEFISTSYIPTYEKFLRNADLRLAYNWERRFLQHLQLDSSPRRWVLKSPDHARTLEELFAVFPDARVVQMHRNPFEVLKSSCQLTRVLRGLYARAPEPNEILARESKTVADLVQCSSQFRDRHPELADRFIDVKYSELIAAPISVLQRIYQQFGLRFTDSAAAEMGRLAAQRARYKKPQNLASLPKGGIASTERDRFERYCARFGLPWKICVAS